MFRRLRSFFEAIVRRDRFEDTLSDEMRFHMDAYAADLVKSGVSPEEAERRARVEFGPLESLKEDARQARGLKWLDEVRQDLRYGGRQFIRAPGFTAAVVTSLALGIGANTAIFSLMDAVLLRTLPVRDPHELYFLAHGSQGNTSSNYPLLERYREANIFSGVTAYEFQTFRVKTSEGVERENGFYVSGNFHAVLGIPFVHGRGFSSESDRDASANPIAVISHEYWSRKFARNPDVIGKTLSIDGRVVTIVGVTVVGILIGLGATVASTQAASTFLFGLSQHDPRTLATVVAVLSATTCLAGYLPARSAALVEPMRALRAD